MRSLCPLAPNGVDFLIFALISGRAVPQRAYMHTIGAFGAVSSAIPPTLTVTLARTSQPSQPSRRGRSPGAIHFRLPDGDASSIALTRLLASWPSAESGACFTTLR